MRTEDLDILLHRLNRSSNDISGIFDILRELLELIDETLPDDGLKAELIRAYTEAMQALNNVLRCNQALYQKIQSLIEVYMCCSAPFEGSFSHDAQGVSESGEKVNEPASSVDSRGIDFEGVAVPPENPSEGVPSHCRVCGGVVSAGAKYCPHCGSAVSIEKPAVPLQKVQFSAVAPKTLSRGAWSIINIIMYEESSRHIVDELINAMDEPSQEIRSGVQKVNEGAAIKVILNSPDVAIEDNIETGVWQGDYLDFSFALQIPENYNKKQILLTAAVYINDVIATKLKFIVKCSSKSEQKIIVSRRDIFSAFISYASQDRNRVAAIIQGMKKARPDLDVFFDVDSLRSGDDWEHAIHDEIKRRDVLFLCWSHFARESKWVDAEWRYALEQKGADCIEPVPIESPDICPPPEELEYKHFNDKLLYIINSAR